MQTDVFNVLFTTATKIPQTNSGIQLLKNAIDAACTRFVANGYCAPGTWNSSGFGILNEGDNLPAGFYVFAPDIALQSQSQRAMRESPLIQCAVKAAGAIHTVDIAITVNP
jgi:hypothetical protein